MHNNEAANDPFIRMRYKDAFDQKDLHKQYEGLMRQLGCWKNVSDDSANVHISAVLPEYDPRSPSSLSRCYNKAWQAGSTMCSYVPDCIPCLWKSTNDINNVVVEMQDGAQPFDRQMFKAYLDACHNKLQSARRWAICKPIVDNVAFIALLACATFVIPKFLPEGGAARDATVLGGGIAAVNMAYHLKEPLQAAHQLLINWPKNDLEDLEERFAANQCFIPKILWPKIIDQFGMARTNQYHQQDCLDFINFALDLTVYAPKPPLEIHINSEGVKQELGRRITTFFNDYQLTKTHDYETCYDITKIVVQVEHFVDALLTDGPVVDRPIYIYLQGPSGIGKTHFAGKLKEWLLELIPNSIHYEEVENINNPDQLQGSKEQPGVLLNCLRHQLAAGKRGTLILNDEATWVNIPSMVDAGKLAFNGNQSKISTRYFGAGREGQGTAIDVPPMLTFIASNHDISDPFLKNRFAIIHFPMPKQEKIVEYAMQKAQRCAACRQLPCDEGVLRQVITLWIQDEKIDNFKQADFVEVFLRSERGIQAIDKLLHT